MYIARDKDGSLHMFKKKPFKSKYWKRWVFKGTSDMVCWLFPDLFPEVSWDDKEPTLIIGCLTINTSTTK